MLPTITILTDHTVSVLPCKAKTITRKFRTFKTEKSVFKLSQRFSLDSMLNIWDLNASDNFSTLLPYESSSDALVRELKVLDSSCDGIILNIWCSIHGFLVCGAVWLPSAQWNLSVRRSCRWWSYKPWSGCVWRKVTLVWPCGVTWLTSVVTSLIWKQHTVSVTLTFTIFNVP
jgi:hypothetical protein